MAYFNGRNNMYTKNAAEVIENYSNVSAKESAL
jgi:hypothetical protein